MQTEPASIRRAPEDPSCSVEIAGTQVRLLGSRALHWPQAATVVIADPHFGKAASFRAHGVPVPHGTTAETLARLEATLAASAARRLVIVGDFLHHARGASAATFAALAQWRDRHRRLEIDLVLGNHDLHAGLPPASLGLRVHPQALDIDGLRFAHAPHVASGRHVIAGHLHPAHVLRSGFEALRLPCFLVGKSYTVLPAFGAFTGAQVVRPAAGDRVFVVAEERVFAVPR